MTPTTHAMPRIDFDRILAQDFDAAIGSEWFGVLGGGEAGGGGDAEHSASASHARSPDTWTATQLFHTLVDVFGHLHEDLMAGTALKSSRKRKATTSGGGGEAKRGRGSDGKQAHFLTGRRRRDALAYLDEVLYTKGTVDEDVERAAADSQPGPATRRKRLLEIEQSPIYAELHKRRKISFKSLVDDVSVSLELAERAYRRSLVVPKTYELFDNEFYHKSIGRGDECLAAVRRTLDEFGFKRHSNQIYFHEEMLKACLRKIYQYDFEQNIDRVLKENGWAKMVQEVLVITARRIGMF